MNRFVHVATLDEAASLVPFRLLVPDPMPPGIVHATVRRSGELAVVDWSLEGTSLFLLQSLELDLGAGRDRFQRRTIENREFMIREADDLDPNTEVACWSGEVAVRFTGDRPVSELVSMALTLRPYAPDSR